MNAVHQFLGHAVVQVAYHVPDIEAAAMAMVKQTGAGPFFVSRNIALALSEENEDRRLLDATHLTWRSMPVLVSLRSSSEFDEAKGLLREAVERVKAGAHHVALSDETFRNRSRRLPPARQPRRTRGKGALGEA